MISSYLIIYRVVQGRAWNSDTFCKSGGMTSLAFNSTLSDQTRTTDDTDDTMTNPTPNAFDNPYQRDEEKSGAETAASMNTQDTMSSSVMWVTKDTA